MTKKKKVVKKKIVKKVAKKKTIKKKVVKKKAPVAKAVKAAVHEEQNWIYCDICGESTGFKHAARGLEIHNVATCADCLIKLDRAAKVKKEEEEAYMLNRSRIRRSRLFSRAIRSIG